MYDVKEMVRDGKMVRLIGVTASTAWYTTESAFHFPVPCSDMAEGKFLSEDRAMLLMRYIRKQIAAVQGLEPTGIAVPAPAATPDAKLIHVTQYEALYAYDNMEVPVMLAEIGDMVLRVDEESTRLEPWIRKHIANVADGARECAA